MKVLIDIGHPAHVHYFRNLIKIMQEKGHLFQVVARDKEVVFSLLKFYKIPFLKRGKGGNGIFGKILYIFYADFKILRMALKFKPDLFLSFSSTYAGHVAFFMRRPHIVFDDTEHAKFEHFMYRPFSDVILNPSCFYKNFGKKQIRFNSYMELSYLHPNRFAPDIKIKESLGVKNNEKYVIVRFVAWQASHDFGHSGLSFKMKQKAVNEFSQYAKVFISSERKLPEELIQYQINIPPERMHDALAYADLFYGESSTMSSECAVLGTPAIFHDNIGRGYTDEQGEKYKIVFTFKESDQDAENAIKKGINILKNPNSKIYFQKRREEILTDKTDLTAFMVWFIENYPSSVSAIANRNLIPPL